MASQKYRERERESHKKRRAGDKGDNALNSRGLRSKEAQEQRQSVENEIQEGCWKFGKVAKSVRRPDVSGPQDILDEYVHLLKYKLSGCTV